MWFSRVESTAQAIAALMLASFSEAFSITVVDSILVMRTHGQSQDFAASLQSFCWGLQVCDRVLTAECATKIKIQIVLFFLETSDVYS